MRTGKGCKSRATVDQFGYLVTMVELAGVNTVGDDRMTSYLLLLLLFP